MKKQFRVTNGRAMLASALRSMWSLDRKSRILSLLALMIMAVSGAWAQEWTNIIVNSDMEGTDVSCFYLSEKAAGGPYAAQISDGVGMNGSRAIKMYSTGTEANAWETQFFIRLPYELPVGTQYRLSFDYRADNTSDFDMQIHKEPSQYIYWNLSGSSTTGGTFYVNWQSYYGEFTVVSTCDGSDNSGGWKNTFQTIAIDVATNQKPTVYFLDNIKLEVPTSALSSLTSNPATNPEPYPMTAALANLMRDAQTLAQDEGAVAVGKLLAAIETAQAVSSPADADIAALQAAIDQFKADNVMDIVDVTANVGTAQTDWQGASGVYNSKKVVSATGAVLAPCESFGDTSVGNKLWQEVTGLENGLYTIELFATSHNAWEGQWMDATADSPVPALQEDANDVAYVFGTSGENTLQTWITARRNSDMIGCEPEAYKVKDLKVENGSLTMGMAIAAEKMGQTEWHTIQICSLKKVTYTSRDQYAALKADMEQALVDAEALKNQGYTEGLDDFNAAIEAATAVPYNMMNVTELEAKLTTLQQAMEDFTLANATFTVSLAEGTEDADNWKVKAGDATEFGDLPVEGVPAGTTVTLKYNGTREVKSIKAKVTK